MKKHLALGLGLSLGALVFFLTGTTYGRLLGYRILDLTGHEPTRLWVARSLVEEDSAAALPVIFDLISDEPLPVSLISIRADPCFPQYYEELEPELEKLPGDARLLKVALLHLRDPASSRPVIDQDFANTPLLEDPALLAAFASAASHPNADLREQVVFALKLVRRAKNPRRDPALDQELLRLLERFTAEDPSPQVRLRALSCLWVDASDEFLIGRLQDEASLRVRSYLLNHLNRRQQEGGSLSEEQRDVLARILVRSWVEQARIVLAEPKYRGLEREALTGRDSPLFGFPDDDSRAVLRLLKALREQPDAIVRLLVENLPAFPGGPLPEAHHRAALELLESQDDPRVIKRLVRYLLYARGEDIIALHALGHRMLAGSELREKLRGAALLGALLSDGSYEAEQAFEKAGLEKAFAKALSPYLTDPRTELRRRCAAALATLYPLDPYRDSFAGLRSDPDPEIRFIAARVLARLEENPELSAAPLLFEVLADEVLLQRQRTRRIEALWPPYDEDEDEDDPNCWSLGYADTSGDRAIGAYLGLQNLGEAVIPVLLAEIRKAEARDHDRLLVTLAAGLGDALGPRAIERACQGEDRIAERARFLSEEDEEADDSWR